MYDGILPPPYIQDKLCQNAAELCSHATYLCSYGQLIMLICNLINVACFFHLHIQNIASVDTSKRKRKTGTR